jgi:hypothetical protein
LKLAGPGDEVWQQLEGELDGGEFLLEAGQPLLHDVLPAVHVGDNLVDGVLRL